MKITFLGALHEVTGSRTMLEWLPGRYLLVDCGMKQGEDILVNEEMPVPASKIEYVLLTHAHIDHSGNLPLLYKQGFRGTVYATPETENLCSIMLADSAHIQESEAESQNKKNLRAGLPEVQPLYTAEDAEAVMKLFRPCQYDKLIRIDEGLTIRFNDIGHLLGSSAIECFMEENGEKRTMVFSGDVGNINQPIIRDPQPIPQADYLMIESTYGNRLHDRSEDPIPLLTDILERTFSRGGSVIIPSFAVGRTQELLYFFREIKQKRLLGEHGDFKVYVDSPMANEATAVFLQCDVSCLDEKTREVMRQGENPIWFDGLNTIVSTEESKALNAMSEPKVIIASGGMCEGGRIRHHLKHNLWEKKNTILFVGYQANGTLGRIIYDGAKSVKIYGEEIDVNAEISLLSGVSGHADQAGLLSWLNRFEEKPKLVFVNHGDDESCKELVRKIGEDLQMEAYAPYSGASFDLLKGEWIRLTDPVYVEKKPQNEYTDSPSAKQKATVRKSRQEDSYSQAVRAASDLLLRIQSLEGHPTKLKQLTKKIREIL